MTILRRRAVIVVAFKKRTSEIKVKFPGAREGTETLTLEDLVLGAYYLSRGIPPPEKEPEDEP
jgi:hypothetical protein